MSDAIFNKRHRHPEREEIKAIQWWWEYLKKLAMAKKKRANISS